MAETIVASITDIARAAFASQLKMGRAFTITSFVTGSGGNDPGDPNTALTPDPTLTALPSQTFGPTAVAQITLTTPYCVEVDCALGLLDAVGPLSNLGLIATYTFSPVVGDPLVGTTFLFAIANRPLTVKTDSESIAFSVLIKF